MFLKLSQPLVEIQRPGASFAGIHDPFRVLHRNMVFRLSCEGRMAQVVTAQVLSAAKLSSPTSNMLRHFIDELIIFTFNQSSIS